MARSLPFAVRRARLSWPIRQTTARGVCSAPRPVAERGKWDTPGHRLKKKGVQQFFLSSKTKPCKTARGRAGEGLVMSAARNTMRLYLSLRLENRTLLQAPVSLCFLNNKHVCTCSLRLGPGFIHLRSRSTQSLSPKQARAQELRPANPPRAPPCPGFHPDTPRQVTSLFFFFFLIFIIFLLFRCTA